MAFNNYLMFAYVHIPYLHINLISSKLVIQPSIEYCMQFWYGFRCTFHVEFISFIVCFISSLQTILKISVIEFKNVGFDFGNCQCFNPAKLNKVIVLWPMTCQEWKSASVLIVGSQTRSKYGGLSRSFEPRPFTKLLP